MRNTVLALLVRDPFSEALGAVRVFARRVTAATNTRMLRPQSEAEPAVYTCFQCPRSSAREHAESPNKMIMQLESRLASKCSMCRVPGIRASMIALTICSSVQVVHAQGPQGNGMHGHDGGGMGSWMGGWAGGWMWFGPAIGVLVVVLLAVVIVKLSKK